MFLRLAPRHLTRAVAAASLAVLALSVGAVTTFAYPVPPASATVIASCTSISQGGSCPVSFKFVAADGTPSQGVAVTFTVGGVVGASVSPTSATTDANGVATTTFFAGTQGCGTATVTATSGSASVQTSINVACAAATPGLPNTSPGVPHPSPWAFVVLGVAALALGGGAVTLRQSRRPA